MFTRVMLKQLISTGLKLVKWKIRDGRIFDLNLFCSLQFLCKFQQTHYHRSGWNNSPLLLELESAIMQGIYMLSIPPHTHKLPNNNRYTRKQHSFCSFSSMDPTSGVNCHTLSDTMQPFLLKKQSQTLHFLTSPVTQLFKFCHKLILFSVITTCSLAPLHFPLTLCVCVCVCVCVRERAEWHYIWDM